MLREGAGKSLATCLKTEFRLVSHICDRSPDFVEGIRALLIDKDGKPKWTHSSARQVKKQKLAHPQGGPQRLSDLRIAGDHGLLEYHESAGKGASMESLMF